MSIKEKLSKALEETETLYRKVAEKSKLLMDESIKLFFDRYPTLCVIKWTQYAPYFNDGDACVFSVHDPVASSNETVSVWGDYEEKREHDWMVSWKDYGPVPLEFKEDFKEFTKFICSGNNASMMENIFGDGTEVTCTRSGIETKEYEHD